MHFPDRFIGPLLGPLGDVVVNLAGDLARGVTQPAGNNLKINAGLGHQGDMGVTEDVRGDFPAQNPQRDFLQVLVVCRILYVIAVTVTEKQSASAAVPEALGKGKGFDLPAQAKEFILHIHIPGEGVKFSVSMGKILL